LLSIVILHNVDFEGGLGQGRGVGGLEIVRIILQLSLGGLHGGRGRVGIVGVGEWNAVGAHVDAVAHAHG